MGCRYLGHLTEAEGVVGSTIREPLGCMLEPCSFRDPQDPTSSGFSRTSSKLDVPLLEV